MAKKNSTTHKVYKNYFEWDELYEDGTILAKRRVWKNKSVHQDFWKDGALRCVTRFNGKLNAFQTEGGYSFKNYSREGKLLMEGKSEGWLSGNHTHKAFYANGKLKEKRTIKKNSLHGKSERFFENGQIKARGKYRYGRSSGIHKKWDSDGNLLFCGRFFNGILLGKDGDGKPLEGFIETYYEDETPQFKGKFINGKLDGIVHIWTRAYPDNHHVQYFYKNGKKHIKKMSDKEFEKWSDNLCEGGYESWVSKTHGKYHTQLLLKYFLAHGGSGGQHPEIPSAWEAPEKIPWIHQKKWNIDFIYTFHNDCTEVLIYWELPLLQQYAGKISRSDFLNPCSDTQSNVWKYFDHYKRAYEVLDTDILTKQLFWNCPKSDHEQIVKKKKRLNNHLFLTLFVPKDLKLNLISYEDFDTQDLAEFFIYYGV